MTAAGASFGANNAEAVVVDNQPPDDARARADLLVAEAENRLERMQLKLAKAEDRLADAKAALAEAKAEAKAARKDADQLGKGD